jgi:uncharacterized membrane protein YozB (DUF420 family)
LFVSGVIFFILAKTSIFDAKTIPFWLINWLIILGLTLFNFSKEKVENKKIEIIRTQALFLSSMTVLGLIISFTLVSNLFHFDKNIDPMLIAFIFNAVFLVTFQIQKITNRKQIGTIEKHEQQKPLKMNYKIYLSWAAISTLAIALIFVLF